MTEPTDMELLSKLLADVGWQSIDARRDESDGQLSCAFTSAYALLGIVFSDSSHDVPVYWTSSQAALMRIAENDSMSHLKDRYLVFFVKEIEESDREELRKVTDDTHACRKICVETRGRPLDSVDGVHSVLAELPFVSKAASDNGFSLDVDESDSELASAGLSSELLDDLGKSGAGTILNRLLDGEYAQETDT